jgi:polysaccharide deacetylase family sporulation protein PdaB
MKRYFFTLIIVLTLVFCFQINSKAIKTRAEFEKTGNAVWDVKTNQKIIALTFDDGPHSKYTPQILKLLAKYNAKATFFVTGERVELYPDITRQISNAGHEIGSHTFSHPRLASISEKNLKNELRLTENVVERITGKHIALFRPVGGYYNDLVVNTAAKEGYRVILWSWNHDSKDWQKPGFHRIVMNVILDIKPGNIILMHDGGGDRSQTVKALKFILPELKRQGYELISVSDLLLRSGYDGIPVYLK